MKLLAKYIIIITLSVCCFNDAFSQISLDLPPVEVIIDSVLKNNGQLKYRKSSVGIKETNIKSARIDLSKHFGVYADTGYGTFNNFLNSEDAIRNSALSTTSKQFNYNFGFYLKIPVLDVINRKHTIKVAKLELEEAEGLVEAQEEIMRQATIRLYQDLILKERLLQIKSRSLGEGKVNMQMVEKEFRNGVVPVAEYVRITSITLGLEIEYEKGKGEYMLAKNLLEDLAGFKFDLITRK